MTRPGVLMLVRLAFALAVLAGVPALVSAQPAQVTLDTDGFDGTDNTVLPTYNAGWHIQSSGIKNDCVIRGTTAAGGSNCADYRTGQTWTADQWSQITLTTNLATVRSGVGVRMQSDNTMSGYVCGFDSNSGSNYVITRWISNAETHPATSSTTRTLGDVINCEALGSTITFRLNGAVLLSTTDATYTTGNPGLSLNTSGTSVIVDSWRAGSVAQPAQPSSGKRGQSR